MKIPFFNKVTINTRFISPTRGLDMDFNIVLYVKNAVHIPLCSLITKLQVVFIMAYVP